jgi:enoyl-CoA hydratase
MAYANITLERDGAVATITVRREKLLNVLNRATLGELGAALREVESDAGLRVALLTGAGERAFVAGADINELRAIPDAAAGRALSLEFHELVGGFIAAMQKPVIAVINGFALGGGLELALACDLRLAADTARLALPEVNLGIMPGWGGTQRLARLAGPSAAKLVALSGEQLDAQEALRIGMVDRIYPAAELRGAAMQLAAGLAAKPPLSLALIKRAVEVGQQQASLADACAYEAELFGQLAQSEDAKEGTSAFLEKRAPVWKGR